MMPDTAWRDAGPLRRPHRPFQSLLRLGKTVFATWLFCLFLVSGATAQDTILHIDSPEALDQAIAAGSTAGATVLLAPGRYGPLTLARGQMPHVIRSADPGTPAEIIGLSVRGFEGLTIEDVALRYHFSPGDRLNLRPFSFSHGTGLVLRNLTVTGDMARDTGTVSDGHASGIGLGVRFSDDVRIEGSFFSRFHRAMAISESRDITISDNEITAIRMDGMVFAQVEDLLITRNHIHSFARALDSDDHADMIQFWTASTTRPSRNITIRDNILHSGFGAFTQSIFINNELVTRGEAGEEMYYRNILIEENVIINAQLHGITVAETIGLTIRRNTLAQNPASAGGPATERVWHPAIRISPETREVVVQGNISGDDRGYVHNPAWQVSDNLVIQNTGMTARGTHYNTIFSGWPEEDPRRLETYRYARPMGAIGASSLHF